MHGPKHTKQTAYNLHLLQRQNAHSSNIHLRQLRRFVFVFLVQIET